jgi:hypothetical protein
LHALFNNAGNSIRVISIASHDQDFLFLIQSTILRKFSRNRKFILASYARIAGFVNMFNYLKFNKIIIEINRPINSFSPDSDLSGVRLRMFCIGPIGFDDVIFEPIHNDR